MPNRRARLLAVIVVVTSMLCGQPPGAAEFRAPSRGACTAQALGPATIDVPSILVRPRLLLNGAPFPGAEAGAAIVTLWASEPSPHFDGPQLVLAETHLGTNPVRVIPGVYDVYYSWISGSGLPRNQLTRVAERVILERDRDLVIDVRMIRVSGVKLHNREPFGYDGAAALSLRSIDRPGSVGLGGAQPAEFDTVIIPGQYAFEYDWQQGANFPNNRHAIVAQLDLDASVEDLVLNVPSVINPFQFRHNGGAFPSTEFDRGDLILRRGATEEVLTGSSHESGGTIRLIPGAYDVHWRHVVGATVPANTDAHIARGLQIDGALRILDVPSIEVSGTFLVNGAPTPASEFENARLLLVGEGGTDTLVLGQTRFGGFVKHVVPGTYDIVYEHLVGAALPINPRATLARAWRVENRPERTIDIPAGRFTGDLLWNGGPFPASEFENGRIHAVPAGSGWHVVPIGQTRFGGVDQLLLPGSYQAAYAHDIGSSLPQNTFTAFGPSRRVIREADAVESLDVRSGPLEVTYLHNGTLLPEGGPQNLRVHLAGGLNYLRLHESFEGPRVIEAMEGRFDLFYQYRGGSGLPRNAFMPFGCWNLTR